MTPGAEHCITCPGKARTFDSLAQCLAETGGWPGDGSDECHGNCLCHLEPQRLYSVFEDTSQSLVRRGGSSRWPGPVSPPPSVPAPSPLTGRAGVGAPSGPEPSPAQVMSEATGTSGTMMEAAALLQAKRGIPPEDQVPPEYREVERWAYQEHYPTAPPPEEILALGLPGAMGHVGHGLWQPIDLVSEALFSLPQGWSPDPASEMQAREAALGLLRDLGFTGDRPKQVLEALERWTRGFHDDPHVLGLVDRYLAAAPRFNGPIVRGFSLPVGRNGWPELGRYDPRAFAGERRTVRPAGKPPGLVLGRAFRVPRPKAFSAGRPFADNTYEVLAGSHAGKSIRGFSVFWAQDEVILPRGVRLMPVRIERIMNPDGTRCVILHMEQVPGT